MSNPTAKFIEWTKQPVAAGEDPAAWLSDLAFDAAWQAWSARDAEIAELQAEVERLTSQRLEYIKANAGVASLNSDLQAQVLALQSCAVCMREALVAQQQAELAHSNCEDCGGEGDWATCGPCSEWFGKAIDLRNSVLQSQPPPLGGEQG